MPPHLISQSSITQSGKKINLANVTDRIEPKPFSLAFQIHVSDFLAWVQIGTDRRRPLPPPRRAQVQHFGGKARNHMERGTPKAQTSGLVQRLMQTLRFKLPLVGSGQTRRRDHVGVSKHNPIWTHSSTLFSSVVMPIAIGNLVTYFEKDQTQITTTEAYVYGGVIVFCRFADAVMAHGTMMGLVHIAMKMRVACSSLIYRKTLRLSRTALAATTVGHVVNLLSNDVNKFDQGFVLANFAWIAPIQAAVGTYLLYNEIGVCAIFGMALLLSFIPLQAWFGKKCSSLRMKIAVKTDKRVRLMNELISGIQVIKMYCWEKPFGQLISLVRRFT
jgi:hypothetical protein